MIKTNWAVCPIIFFPVIKAAVFYMEFWFMTGLPQELGSWPLKSPRVLGLFPDQILKNQEDSRGGSSQFPSWLQTHETYLKDSKSPRDKQPNNKTKSRIKYPKH